MTGEQLKTELARIAEGAPQVEVADDLFARGRRAAGRTRVLVGAAAVACLALVVGVSAQALLSDEAPVADGDSDRPVIDLLVPDHIYAPPAHVTEGKDDLDIGTAAAAFVTDTGLCVVIDAATGGYHLVELEGSLLSSTETLRSDAEDAPVALSPDGRHLAWAFADAAPDTSDGDRRSGVRIADLDTGEVSTYPVDAGHAVWGVELAWSANGDHVAWSGHRTAVGNETDFSRDAYIGGVLTVADPETPWTRLPGVRATVQFDGGTETLPADPNRAIAVSDSGRLAAVVGTTLQMDGQRVRFAQDHDWRLASLWFEGEQVRGLEFPTTGANVPVVRVLPDGRSTPFLSTIQEPRLVGALGPRSLLVASQTSEGEDRHPAVVELWEWSVDGTDSGSPTLIDLEPGVLSLTLATDLIDPADPRVAQRPEPDWPWSTARKIAVYGGSALLVVLLGGGAWLLVRRFRG